MQFDYNPEKLSMVPEHLRDGLQQYIEYGLRPGSGLTAVLRNNLSDAVACLDEVGLADIREIVWFIYGHAPSQCWGSEEKIRAWVAAGGIHGKESMHLTPEDRLRAHVGTVR